MGEIKRAPQGIGRLAEIQHDDPGAGPSHPVHFLQPPLPKRQIPQAVAHRHDVKGVFRKRNFLGVPLEKRRSLLAGGPFLIPAADRGLGQHGFAEIQTGCLRAAARKGKRQVAGAAAQIQCAVAVPDSGEPDHAAFPKPVKAEALEIIDQVIAPGDGGEKIADLGGALGAGIVKRVAHPSSLAWRREEKSKPEKLSFFCRGPFARVEQGSN